MINITHQAFSVTSFVTCVSATSSTRFLMYCAHRLLVMSISSDTLMDVCQLRVVELVNSLTRSRRPK